MHTLLQPCFGLRQILLYLSVSPRCSSSCCLSPTAFLLFLLRDHISAHPCFLCLWLHSPFFSVCQIKPYLSNKERLKHASEWSCWQRDSCLLFADEKGVAVSENTGSQPGSGTSISVIIYIPIPTDTNLWLLKKTITINNSTTNKYP